MEPHNKNRTVLSITEKIRNDISKNWMALLSVILATIALILYIASFFWGLLLLPICCLLFILHNARVKKIPVKQSSKDVMTSVFKKIYFPLAGIILALVIGAIIMLITGYNPIRAYGALFYGGFIRNWTVSLLNAVPLIFTGLSIAVAFKAGLFNIGAEGQYYIGTMVAAILGIYFNIPGILAIPLIFVVGALLSSTYIILPTWLKIRTGAHEVITTMMFAHIARLLSPAIIRAFGGDPATSSHPYVTDAILPQLHLPNFSSLIPEWLPSFLSFTPANHRLHIGILIAIGIAIFIYWFINHTSIGFEIRTVGLNSVAARTQGISTGKVIMYAMLISGALAGLAGVVQVVGVNYKMFEDLNAGYGWNGIAVALLASNHPIGVIFTAILWGALDAGGQYMQRNIQTPNSIVEIIKGIILFLIVARYIYSYFGSRWTKKKNVTQETSAV